MKLPGAYRENKAYSWDNKGFESVQILCKYVHLWGGVHLGYLVLLTYLDKAWRSKSELLVYYLNFLKALQIADVQGARTLAM